MNNEFKFYTSYLFFLRLRDEKIITKKEFKEISPWISGGAQPKLNQKNLNKINIPMPSLADQERIVGILDRFDALCNDLSSGLPAEIEAREKQYEFYRDKLLTFKQL